MVLSCRIVNTIRHFCFKLPLLNTFIIPLIFDKLLYQKNLTFKTMSQCGKNCRIKVPGYLLIFTLLISLACFSNKAFSQDSTSTKGRHRHERPKHPSFKKMLDKVNIFKKHKNEDTAAKATTQQPAPTPAPPPPPPPKPQQKTDSVKPKTTVKHTGTKKKAKKTIKTTTPTPPPAKPKPKTEKQATPII